MLRFLPTPTTLRTLAFQVWRDNKPGVIAVLLALVLSLPGIHWGYYECWNYDQMAHLRLRKDGLPQHYMKPPLLTYLNQSIVLPVVTWIVEKPLFQRMDHHPQLRVLTSRALTLAMFLGSVWLVWRAAMRSGNPLATGAIALLFATSSGVLVFNRFLTTDSPLLFWMLAAAFAAMKAAEAVAAQKQAAQGAEPPSERTKLAWSVAAGLLAGLAGAMKYNGILAAAAIPAAFFAAAGFRFLAIRGFWLASVCVPIGFVLGNPGALVDFPRFWADFYYNLKITPVYTGETGGPGYGKFFASFPDLAGWPGTVILALGAAGLLMAALRGALSPRQWVLVAVFGSVALIYTVAMGRFPRTGGRFVLPVIPFAFVVAAAGWAYWLKLLPGRVFRYGAAAVAALALAYNVACSIESGLRFLSDPRMPAWEWVRTHIPESATIENSYAPNWLRMPKYRPNVTKLPAVTGRSALFSEMFKNDPTVQRGVAAYETGDDALSLFTPEALRQRNPDFIAYSTQVFEWTGNDDVQRFYGLLDAEQLGYRKVYERRCRPRAWWSYPAGIDFLVERMVILQRATESGS